MYQLKLRFSAAFLDALDVGIFLHLCVWGPPGGSSTAAYSFNTDWNKYISLIPINQWDPNLHKINLIFKYIIQ